MILEVSSKPRGRKLPRFFISLIFPVVLIAASAGCGAYKGNQVSIAKPPAGGYELIVNGVPLYIQGVGVGEGWGKEGENYLALARELGANTVRTWGVDQGTQKYLDEAHRQGLFVFAGIWINFTDKKQGVCYTGGCEERLKAKEKEALDYVRAFKDHPAVIAWNVGNECLFFTKDENEKIALAQFIEKLIVQIKKIDPHHPVVYASVNTLDLKYLKKYVPSLDIVGMNIYGSVIGSQSGWTGLSFDKPYVVTEFGPLGPWDLPKDQHGKMVELSDYVKAGQYKTHWSLIRERRGKNIGGFVFHLGETSQESLTMWNLNDGVLKKEPFVVMQKFYGAAKEPLDHAPKIRSFQGVPPIVSPGQDFDVRVAAEDPEGSDLSYEFKASSAAQDVLQYYVNEEVPLEVKGKGPNVTILAPQKPGIYRIYAFVRDTMGRSSSANDTMEVEG